MSWLKKNKWQVGLLALLVLVSYVNVWKAEFVADDVYGIVNNEFLGEFKTVFKNPLVWPRNLYYFLVVNIFGKAAWAFRLLNICSHLLMSIGVYFLVKLMMNKKVGMIAGVLTAVHPIMVESVTWISGGGHSYYALMLILAMILYIKSKQDFKYLWWGLASFLMALFFSEKAASFPGILLVYELVFGNLKRNLRRLGPFFLLSGLWVGVYAFKVQTRRHLLVASFSGQAGMGGVSWWQQIPIAISSYWSLILWPVKLTLYHSEMFFSKFEFWLRIAAVTGYLGVIIWGFLKKKRQLVFWMSWFLIGLAVTLAPAGVAWIVAERYVYFSAVGIYVLAGMLVDWLSKKEGLEEGVMIGFGLLVLLLMIRTLVRNSNWQTADKLWLSAERISPNSPQNNNNLGDYYGRMGDLKRAEQHFLKAIELNPNYADAMHNLGNTYVQMREFEKAKEYYGKALEKKPELWQSKEQLKKLDEYLKKSI